MVVVEEGRVGTEGIKKEKGISEAQESSLELPERHIVSSISFGHPPGACAL